MKFEQALKAMREGKRVKISKGTWKCGLFGADFYFSSLENDCWTRFPDFPCFLLLAEDWEIVQDDV